MSASLDQSPDRHRWTLKGHRVTQFCADLGSARLQSWSLQSSLEIRLAVPFALAHADGIVREVDPDEPERLAPLLSLLGREIVELVVTHTGALSVAFSDGTTISVESHPRYEAFEVQGGGELEGLAYLAGPGGGPPWG